MPGVQGETGAGKQPRDQRMGDIQHLKPTEEEH